jgi:hypothetical protein
VDISLEDLEALRRGKALLEGRSLATRFANAVGQPVEKILTIVRPSAAPVVTTAVNRALQQALDLAIRSLRTQGFTSTERFHKAAVAMTGATGGAFGIAAIAVELPVSTSLMLRSIAEIAQSEGERLDSVEARLACLQVFALGGPTTLDHSVDAGYFAIRAAMAKTLEEAAQHVAKSGISHKGAPVLVRFLGQVAVRFGIPVSEKVVAQSVPIIGALGGAAINVLFLNHFQDLARGHFIVRRLERKYGSEPVQRAFSAL